MLFMILGLTGLLSQMPLANSVKELYTTLLRAENLLMDKILKEIMVAHH